MFFSTSKSMPHLPRKPLISQKPDPDRGHSGRRLPRFLVRARTPRLLGELRRVVCPAGSEGDAEVGVAGGEGVCHLRCGK